MKLLSDIRGAISIRSIVEVIVVLVVGLSLLPIVISTTATAAASLTGASATLVNLIPLFYVIALVLAVIYWAVQEAKTK
jgi:hypothetical protein